MTMIGHDPWLSTAENYRRFAVLQARGRSAHYEALAAAVAEDPAVLAFLCSLPPAKRQPNLLFRGCLLPARPAWLSCGHWPRTAAATWQA